ncbi:hypothetical protein FACS189426_00950 [Bacteroidia bacterium]|nr:hypothetical protein FACS189426_00950 [Bacteroidia bacterium]
MDNAISPKYQMKLVNEVEQALWNEFSESKYFNVEKYLEKWQEWDDRYDGSYHIGWSPDFVIEKNQNGNIDLKSTLHNISKVDSKILLKIAIELGVNTPDFIPSIPTFKNSLKSDYKTKFPKPQIEIDEKKTVEDDDLSF